MAASNVCTVYFHNVIVLFLPWPKSAANSHFAIFSDILPCSCVNVMQLCFPQRVGTDLIQLALYMRVKSAANSHFAFTGDILPCSCVNVQRVGTYLIQLALYIRVGTYLIQLALYMRVGLNVSPNLQLILSYRR